MSASALRISAAVCAYLVLHCFSRSRSRLEACAALRVSAHLCDSLRFSSALSLYLTAPTALAPDYLLYGRVIESRGDRGPMPLFVEYLCLCSTVAVAAVPVLPVPFCSAAVAIAGSVRSVLPFWVRNFRHRGGAGTA